MKKVILFGGSFNPIHYGHLQMAQQALLQQGAFELWFIPTLISPFKEDSSDFDKRCHMIELMIQAESKMKVCTIEQSLPKPSYSINTVQKLKAMYPEYEFEWLIGDDQMEKLHLWHDFETLKKEVQFIVYARDAVHHDYPVVQGDILSVSSTGIRQGTQFATKPSILRYMMEEGLYLDEMLKYRLSKYRYEHTLSVHNLALELAKVHHINLKQVSLAALMHDYCKEDYSDVYIPNNLAFEALHHAYGAAAVLSKHYYIKDRQVLRAIKGHVSGTSTSPLGMILYIADKCERTRQYDTEPWITMAKKDLRKTFKQLKEFTLEYRKEA